MPEPIEISVVIGDMPTELRLRKNTGNIFIFYEVLAFRAYALPDSRLPPDEVRTIVDCGANIGLTSLFFAQQYPNARIYAVEPEPGNFELLKRNTTGIERITPLQQAIVGTPTKYVTFSTNRPAWGNHILMGDQAIGGTRVSATTLDDLMASQSIAQIDILKVDIEGGEVDVFAHPQFLSRVGLVLIELHGDYGVREFQQAIAPLGFRVGSGDGDTPAGVVMAYPECETRKSIQGCA